ncbi:hypothetical protein RRG08_054510 [Elysia crispata]|uniref:Uncharacterized protein n=1 Tax=Elysia crispata TaxID=231223 RepID=A0AAE0YUG9_9GAST|nr:hypothetical protein RRG08_054510 [Elysia crispata]
MHICASEKTQLNTNPTTDKQLKNNWSVVWASFAVGGNGNQLSSNLCHNSRLNGWKFACSSQKLQRHVTLPNPALSHLGCQHSDLRAKRDTTKIRNGPKSQVFNYWQN